MNHFSPQEMHQLLLDFTQGMILRCPRCNGILESRLERGGLFPGQVSVGPMLTHLIVECTRERIAGKTVFGA